MSHARHKTWEIAAAISKWQLVAPFTFKVSYLHNNTAQKQKGSGFEFQLSLPEGPRKDRIIISVSSCASHLLRFRKLQPLFTD